MSRRTTDPDIMRLHVRDRLAADGTPAMAERFLSRLDRCLAATREDAPSVPALTLAEACARLAAERPVWWACVDLCCRQGLTERAAAVRLGVSPALAHRRKVRGLEQLAVWCDADDAGDVALVLQHGRPSRAS